VNTNILATIGALIMVAAPWAITPAQATIIYSIDQSSTTPIVAGEPSPMSDTVRGTITTNGTIGALQSADILDYNLQLIDNLHPAFDFTLTPANSGIWYDTGNALIAAATTLSFDFGASGAVFLIQGTTPHGFSSGFNYLCFQATTGPCLPGETIVPNYYTTDGVRITALIGVAPLAVPEPASWAMMLAGLAVIGQVLRQRTLLAPAYI
jgi:hypothetical protein